MKPQNEDPQATQPQWFDPFPEPQTIPAGWDTSTFVTLPLAEALEDESAES